MTKYDKFEVDGNTVWIDYGTKGEQVVIAVRLPTGEMFEDFVKRNKPIILKIGDQKRVEYDNSL